MIWRFPFAKLAEFPSCFQVVMCLFTNIYRIVPQKLPKEQIKLLNCQGSSAGVPDVLFYSSIRAQGQGPSRLWLMDIFAELALAEDTRAIGTEMSRESFIY